ncbi:o-succinylbenzoate synthase [Robiginitalea sp. IMCC44478]|uniref:o-succinylbenzoate synthase n=1 Tax=Robiginitalea sp. IMCC44478 TaxID=3459122 RepID=UPI004042F8B5
MRATFTKYILEFKRPGGTSRGVLRTKETFFIYLQEGPNWGIGECGLFRGLSADDLPDYEQKLQWACDHIQQGEDRLRKALQKYPSIVFGIEQAFRSLRSDNPMELFTSPFLTGQPIPINGLIWMGDISFMQEQVATKLAEGFRCLKLKIGALDFREEFKLLQSLRERFSAEQLEIRVDANGAFHPATALERLRELASLQLHSIEQPIRAGQIPEMAALCRKSPLPIALDEELIGVFEKKALLEEIQPAYIILKPSLTGGFAASEEWISLAEEHRIGWWVTSALESNIGLNAIAQWTATLKTKLPQGLGTGGLFTNNIAAPLEVKNANLWYRPEKGWDYSQINRLCT